MTLNLLFESVLKLCERTEKLDVNVGTIAESREKTPKAQVWFPILTSSMLPTTRSLSLCTLSSSAPEKNRVLGAEHLSHLDDEPEQADVQDERDDWNSVVTEVGLLTSPVSASSEPDRMNIC